MLKCAYNVDVNKSLSHLDNIECSYSVLPPIKVVRYLGQFCSGPKADLSRTIELLAIHQ